MELGSKKYKFGPKSDHERSTNAAEVGKSFEFFSFNCKFRSGLSNRVENKIQLVCIEDLKNICFKPKIDDIRLKFCRIGNCRQLVSEIGRKFTQKKVLQRNYTDFSITWPKITVNRPNSTICQIALNFEIIKIFTSRIF